MSKRRRLVLKEVRIKSFVTDITTAPQKNLLGGLSAGDCQFSMQLDCTNQDNCSDSNKCDNTGCCSPPIY